MFGKYLKLVYSTWLYLFHHDTSLLKHVSFKKTKEQLSQLVPQYTTEIGLLNSTIA